MVRGHSGTPVAAGHPERINVRSARPDDAKVAAILIYMTMSRVTDYLFGREEVALWILPRVFARASNRFSHKRGYHVESVHLALGWSGVLGTARCSG